VTAQLETIEMHCSWCGEPGEVTVDPSGGDRQRYVEDCWVCCRPNVVVVRIERHQDDQPEVSVTVSQE
jgi:hypothetical protein